MPFTILAVRFIATVILATVGCFLVTQEINLLNMNSDFATFVGTVAICSTLMLIVSLVYRLWVGTVTRLWSKYKENRKDERDS